MAAKRQEEKKRVEDKEEGNSSRGRKEDLRDPDVLGSKRVPKSSNDVTGECWTGPALQGISVSGRFPQKVLPYPCFIHLKYHEFPACHDIMGSTVN